MRKIALVVIIAFLIGLASTGEAQVLKKGMRGTEVTTLQNLLVDLGHDLVVDGVFGSKTEALVKTIQQALGLKIDGIVGQETMSSLNQLQQSIITYTVQNGDNLTRLAKRYDTTVRDISSYNALRNPDQIRAGQILRIPTNSLVVLSNLWFQQPRFNWPVQGKITSGYGYRTHPVTKNRHFHGGIDIAVPVGTAVRAAASGRVIKAGGMGNYGLGVVIDHGGDYTTWYGHNSKVLVRVDELVQVGQIIALSGRSGLATGPHLDFRIKKGDQTVDPLEYLF